MKDNVLQFNVGYAKLLEFAAKQKAAGNTEKEIMYLHQILRKFPGDYKATLSLAEAYMSVGQFGFAKQKLFDILASEKKGETKIELPIAGLGEIEAELSSNDDVYFDLVMCLTGDDDNAAEFYLSKISDISKVDDTATSTTYFLDRYQTAFRFDDETEGLMLVKPRGDEYYKRLIEEAKRKLLAEDYGAVVDMLKGVRYLKFQKDLTALLNFAYLGQGNEEKAEEIIASVEADGARPGDLAMMYMFFVVTHKEDKAAKILERIKSLPLPSDLETLLKFTKIYAMALEHQKLFECVSAVLRKKPLDPEAMLWKALSLYNLGKKEEAVVTLKKIAEVYPEMTVAESHLSYLQADPPLAFYTQGEPFTEYLKHISFADSLVGAEYSEWESFATLHFDEICWCIKNLGEESVERIIEKCAAFYGVASEKIFEKLLMDAEVDLQIKHKIVAEAVRSGKTRFKAVSENVYKTFRLTGYVPEYYRKKVGLPRVFLDAFCLAVGDEALVNVYPQKYLANIERVAAKTLRKIVSDGPESGFYNLKSVPTLVAVFCYYAEKSDADFDLKELLNGLMVKPKTFEKYLELFEDKK